MFTCKDFDELCSESQDRDLSRVERAKMWLRCLVCSASRGYKEQMYAVREAMLCYKKALTEEGGCLESKKLSDEARERIKRACRDQ